jgi:hypothetical protein
VSCRADRKFANNLAAVVSDLKEAAVEGQWDVDWHDVNQLLRGASQAANGGDFPEVVRCYARAIRFLMDQARRQKATHSDDSILDE